MIERWESGITTWRSESGYGAISFEAPRGLKLPDDSELTWTPPEGVTAIGEFLIRSGKIIQPCLRVTSTSYTNPDGESAVDDKAVFDIASIDQADHETIEWIAGATPDEATVDGKYNAALDGSPAISEAPWGRPADVGAEFLDLLVHSSIAVPQFLEGNQLYAIDLDTGGRLWHKAGYENYPTALANFGPADDPYEFGEDPNRSDLDYYREFFTPLGISGPIEDKRLIVEIRKEYLAPSIRPDFINGRISRELELESYCTGDPFAFAVSYSLRGWWQWRSAGPIDIDPSSGYTALGLFEGSSWLFGNPEILGRPSNIGQTFNTETESETTDSLDQLLEDCLELAETTAYLGHFVYKVERRIESLNLETGEVLATRALEEPCVLPGANMCGAGTATQTEYSKTAVLSWPIHPGEGEDWTPDVPNRKHHHPPPIPLEGYIGGSYQDRAFGPLFLHCVGEVDNSEETFRYACPDQPEYAPPTYFSLLSIHAGDLIATGTVPTGIFLPTLSNGDYTVAPDGDYTLTLCYSAKADGDKALLGRSLPWPFDPLSMACTEDILVFGPKQFNHFNMTLTRQGQSLDSGGDFDLPEWDDEVERIHYLHAWDPLTLVDKWAPINLRDFVDSTVLSNDLLHPSVGDRLGNLVIYENHLWVGISGADNQKLLEVRIYETEDGDAGQVVRSINIGDSAIRPNPFYVDSSEFQLAPNSLDRCQDSLVIAGGRLFGITANATIWQLV